MTPNYGQHLQGCYLFGSYARGENRPGSDVDVLIVLDDYASYSAEITRTSEVISELSLSHVKPAIPARGGMAVRR